MCFQKGLILCFHADKRSFLVFNSTKTAIDFEKVHHDVRVMFNTDDQKESANHVE